MGAEFSNARKDIRSPEAGPISDDRSLSPLNTPTSKPLEQLDPLELKNLETNLSTLQGIIDNFCEEVARMLCDPLDKVSGPIEEDLPIRSETIRQAYELLTTFTLQSRQYEAIVPAIETTTHAIQVGIRTNLDKLTTLKNETSIDVSQLHEISRDIRKLLSYDTETLTPQIHYLLQDVKLRRESGSPSDEGLV
jgi:hypothetical protein